MQLDLLRDWERQENVMDPLVTAIISAIVGAFLAAFSEQLQVMYQQENWNAKRKRREKQTAVMYLSLKRKNSADSLLAYTY